MTAPADTPSTELLPTGVWQVDTTESTLGFKARGMFGLVPVKGTFSRFSGTLHVDATGANGELTIESDSLDTGNKKRDEHLRSADFFDVEHAPTVTFELTGISAEHELTGVLKIRENSFPFSAPLHVHGHDDHLHVGTTVSVDRSAAGVGWSKAGMIQGKAHLSADLLLTRLSA